MRFISSFHKGSDSVSHPKINYEQFIVVPCLKRRRLLFTTELFENLPFSMSLEKEGAEGPVP